MQESSNTPPASPRRHRLACLASALLASLLLGVLLGRSVELCRGALSEVKEPQGWRASQARARPESDAASQLLEFKVQGRSLLHKYGLGLQEAKLHDPRLCESRGVSLDAWFERGPEPAYMRTPGELRLRQDGALYTVSAVPFDQPAAPEAHVVSFVRKTGYRPSFTSTTGGLGSLTLALSLVAALFGAWRPAWARRALLLSALLLGITLAGFAVYALREWSRSSF